MPTDSSADLLIGAHTSAAGGVYNALIQGEEIGATVIQFFTSNQRQWGSKPYTEELMRKWKETLASTKLTHLMSHASYLINLASFDEELREKSLKAFRNEVSRCLSLGVSYLNFHPGSALKNDRGLAMERIIENLLSMQDLLENQPLTLLFESTAGQGSQLGSTLEELSFLIERTKGKLNIGVCIDTCHSFTSGYDLSQKKGTQKFLNQFDEIVGLKHLKAFHINDSKKECGSHVDRHALLGEGCIGWETFEILVSDERTRHLPFYLETPGGVEGWKREIKHLRSVYSKGMR